MCGNQKCKRSKADMCSCGPVQEGNVVRIVQHLVDNMIDETWELDYTDLNHPEDRRLCLVGVCRKCGCWLCINIGGLDELIGNDFLVDTYRRLHELYHTGWRHMPKEEFWARFVQMLHEQDRPSAAEYKTWLQEQYGEGTV